MLHELERDLDVEEMAFIFQRGEYARWKIWRSDAGRLPATGLLDIGLPCIQIEHEFRSIAIADGIACGPGPSPV